MTLEYLTCPFRKHARAYEGAVILECRNPRCRVIEVEVHVDDMTSERRRVVIKKVKRAAA